MIPYLEVAGNAEQAEEAVTAAPETNSTMTASASAAKELVVPTS